MSEITTIGLDLDPVDLIETPIAVPTWASGHAHRNTKAGHMTASDTAAHTTDPLREGGHPHMFRGHLCEAAPDRRVKPGDDGTG